MSQPFIATSAREQVQTKNATRLKQTPCVGTPRGTAKAGFTWVVGILGSFKSLVHGLRNARDCYGVTVLSAPAAATAVPSVTRMLLMSSRLTMVSQQVGRSCLFQFLKQFPRVMEVVQEELLLSITTGTLLTLLGPFEKINYVVEQYYMLNI